ncbi:glutaredoxin-1 [Apteryx rowi]|uniref:glutaredoxin-1 n=1 Tax=Apteryx rowi TaxID=308060 RepID=UPI000E1DFF62|nr:glutaredoxin-1 [Apteryx rowi]
MADWFVKNRIRNDKVTVFMKPTCPYCRNAMGILREFNFRPGCLESFDITGMDDVQDYFQQTTGQRTVPLVFIGKTCIGGFSDLQNLYGQLPVILRQIDALQ